MAPKLKPSAGKPSAGNLKGGIGAATTAAMATATKTPLKGKTKTKGDMKRGT